MVSVNDECLVFYIFRVRTITENTWKILKLDWKTPGKKTLLDFFIQKSGNPV